MATLIPMDARLPAPADLVTSEPAAPPPPADWQRYLAAVLRFKWVVAGVTLGLTVLGAVAAVFLPSTYAAQATIWIQVPNRAPRDEGPIWEGQLPISSGWTDLLQSFAVLDSVARGQRLYLQPRSPADTAALATLEVKDRVLPGAYRLVVDRAGTGFTLLAGRAGRVLQRGAVGDSVGAAVGLAWVPPAAALAPGRAVAFTITAPYEAARQLGRGLKVSADLDGNFLRLELAGHDRARVATTLNAVADRFVAVAGDLKREKLGDLSGILNDQLHQAQDKLGRAEAALRDFRVHAVTTFALGTGSVTENMQYPRDPVFAGLLDLKVTLDQTRRDREAIERVLAQAADSGGVAVDALTLVGAVQRSTDLAQVLRDLTAKQAELRALRAHYTDENASVRRLAAEVGDLEHQTIPRLAASLAAELKVRETELAQRVDAASAGLRQIPPLAVEEARLERDVTLDEQLVTNLQQRYEEARLADVSSMPDVRLLDRAVEPQQPVGHTGLLLTFVSLLGGLSVGVGAAVVLDRTDRRVRYPDHVTGAMGLTILGAVPHVEWRGDADTTVAQVVEALRGIRLNVVHRHGSAGPVVLTITSPGKSDGKSFVAANLAIAFADAGYRTLLVDGDVRRGRLHRALGVSRKPGLTDVLAGTAALAEVLRQTAYHNLWFIPCGFRTYSGPAQLTAAPMVRLMSEVRGSYDAVIVDSPPLAAGADGFALGTVTGTLALVLRTGVSDRELAGAKLEVLQHLPIRVLGAVLNDVRPHGAYRYYSYYLEGYEVRDEPGEAAAHLVRGPAEG